MSWVEHVDDELTKHLPVYTRQHADEMIEDHNAKCWKEDRNRDRWFVLTTGDDKQYIAQITHASGGGRVSFVPDGKDFCNLVIEYAFYGVIR